MKVNLEKLSNLERRLNIEVPVEKVTQAFERIYKKIQSQVTLDGFRKGKAPISQIKQMYRDHAYRDVIEELVQQSYMVALEEQSLDPVNYPNIKIEDLNEATPFKFTAEFEVRPDVQLEQYKNLPVEKELFHLDETKIDETIENLRKQRGELVTVFEDRAAQMGDHAVIDFEGTVNGTPLENATGHEHTLELGSHDFIPGFEEGIIGMRMNETRIIDLKFPDEYHADQLAGKPVSFKVTLTGLKKRVLPEVNDEFAKTLGIDTAEALRAAIKEDQLKSETRRIDEEFKNRILKALVDRNPVDVPKSMLDDQKKLLVDDVLQRMQSQGMSMAQFEDYKSKWDDDFTKSATFMIQSGFLVNAIAAKENLKATDSDVEARIDEYASTSGLEVARLKEFYAKEENRSRLRYKITEDKVMSFLIENAAIREVAKDQIKGSPSDRP